MESGKYSDERHKAFCLAIDRLEELNGEPFHGYRSEVWSVLADVYAAGQQSRTPGPATAKILETLQFALSCGENRGPLYLNPEDVEGILAEWPAQQNAPADDRGGEDAAG